MATSQTEEFVFRWLKGYFPSDEINPDDIPDVLHFSLMWNLFESKVCESLENDPVRRPFVEKMDCSIKKLPSINSFVSENCNRSLSYFQERYIDDGEVNYKFHELKFTKHDKESLVQRVLKEKDNSVFLALLIIIYRLRCNFFHGIKPFSELKVQNINFKESNRFLADVLDLYNKSKQ